MNRIGHDSSPKSATNPIRSPFDTAPVDTRHAPTARSKAVASTVRKELAARGVELSHSDSLEIAAKAFGSTDWNTLSAKIKQAATRETRVGEDASHVLRLA